MGCTDTRRMYEDYQMVCSISFFFFFLYTGNIQFEEDD